MSEETVKCSEVIKSCAYSALISNCNSVGMRRFCDYLGKTGKRRGCNPEECNKFKNKKGD